MRTARWLIVAAAASGCGREATFTGIVLAWHNAPSGASGAELTLRDADFEPLTTTTTGLDGSFTLTAPALSEIHLEIGGEGLVPIAFAGSVGAVKSFAVPDGQLWAFRPEDEARWRADFAGCPGAEDGAGMIVGTTYPSFGDDVTPQGAPWPNAFAYVEPRDTPGEGRIDACYLTDDTDAPVYDPAAWRTGATGRFAFFGVEGGPWALTLANCTVRTDDGCSQSTIGRSTVYVPEGGVVERNPALVPL